MSMINKLIYQLGKKSRVIRVLYWKLSGHKYLWGICRAIADIPLSKTDSKEKLLLPEGSDWIDRNIDKIFPKAKEKEEI